MGLRGSLPTGCGSSHGNPRVIRTRLSTLVLTTPAPKVTARAHGAAGCGPSAARAITSSGPTAAPPRSAGRGRTGPSIFGAVATAADLAVPPGAWRRENSAARPERVRGGNDVGAALLSFSPPTDGPDPLPVWPIREVDKAGRSAAAARVFSSVWEGSDELALRLGSTRTSGARTPRAAVVPPGSRIGGWC